MIAFTKYLISFKINLAILKGLHNYIIVTYILKKDKIIHFILFSTLLYLVVFRYSILCGKTTLGSAMSSSFINLVRRRIPTAPMSYNG